MNLSPRFRSNLSIVLGICAVAVLVFFLFKTTLALNKTNKELVDAENKYGEIIALLEQDLTSTREEADRLFDEVNDLKDKNERLTEDNEEYEEEVDELTKLTTLDPELLKKYSKVFFLNENYAPEKLDRVNKKFLLDQNRPQEIHDDVERYLRRLLEEAEDDGIDLRVASAYRSFGTQAALKSNYVVTYGAGTANSFSAEQGYSEHQLGTAVDFAIPSAPYLTTAFDQTEAYKWLVKNAYRYGFVISYPKGNAYYQYEPWHWRFVGVDLARKINRDKTNFYDLDQRTIDKYLIRIFD